MEVRCTPDTSAKFPIEDSRGRVLTDRMGLLAPDWSSTPLPARPVRFAKHAPRPGTALDPEPRNPHMAEAMAAGLRVFA